MRQWIGSLLWTLGTPVRSLLVTLLVVYRGTAGRLLGGRCRFHPSCSAYALEAVRTHGAFKGTILAGWRVLRCSPLTLGGPEPVPPPGRWSHVNDAVIHSGPAEASR